MDIKALEQNYKNLKREYNKRKEKCDAVRIEIEQILGRPMQMFDLDDYRGELKDHPKHKEWCKIQHNFTEISNEMFHVQFEIEDALGIGIPLTEERRSEIREEDLRKEGKEKEADEERLTRKQARHEIEKKQKAYWSRIDAELDVEMEGKMDLKTMEQTFKVLEQQHFATMKPYNEMLTKIENEQLPVIQRAATLAYRSMKHGGLLHVFSTGHSHMIVEEMFYRTGGLATINPLLSNEFMLHEGATSATINERTSGKAEAFLSTIK